MVSVNKCGWQFKKDKMLLDESSVSKKNMPTPKNSITETAVIITIAPLTGQNKQKILWQYTNWREPVAAVSERASLAPDSLS